MAALWVSSEGHDAASIIEREKRDVTYRLKFGKDFFWFYFFLILICLCATLCVMTDLPSYLYVLYMFQPGLEAPYSVIISAHFSPQFNLWLWIRPTPFQRFSMT